MNERSYPESSSLSVVPLSRRKALRVAGQGAIAASLITWLGPESVGAVQQSQPSRVWSDPEATRGGHGQLIVGDGPVYLSHFPFFMFDTPTSHPHHFQVILEVAFTADDGDPLAAYLADKESTGGTLYSLAPDEDLQMLDLIGLDTDPDHDQSLLGKIVREHFERTPGFPPVPDESIVVDGVTAKVEHVIYAHEFAFEAEPLDALEYILFGQGENLFLAHRIVGPPSFDQVLPARIAGHAFSDAELRDGIVVAIPERRDSVSERLRDEEQVAGEARQAESGETISADLTITASPEIFFEEGELRFPGEFAPTGEETAAGFGD